MVRVPISPITPPSPEQKLRELYQYVGLDAASPAWALANNGTTLPTPNLKGESQ